MKPPKLKQLILSRYNGLPDDGDQSPVAEEHIRNLAALFVCHNAHEVLGVHLTHGHFKIPESAVVLGTNFQNPNGRWVKATEIVSIDSAAVHGHIYVLTYDGCCAYEYQDGPIPDLSIVGKDILPEFVKYLFVNNLIHLLGLQILIDGMDQTTWEFVLDQGTVMLYSAAVRGCSPTRITGWRFESQTWAARVCQANKTHAEMTSGNHKVFNSGKPQPKLSDVEDLKRALMNVDVL